MNTTWYGEVPLSPIKKCVHTMSKHIIQNAANWLRRENVAKTAKFKANHIPRAKEKV